MNVKSMTGVAMKSGTAMKTGVSVLQRSITAQKLYAKALYDNLADFPDEIAFKKGDILTVIEQDTNGLAGWWLCALRGRQGMCPGNRLRILDSYDSGCFSLSPTSSPGTSLAASTATLNSSICSNEIYENTSIFSGTGSVNGSSSGHGSGSGSGFISASQTQLNHQQQSMQQLQQRHGTRRSWHVSPNKVVTPQRHGDVYIYNCPSTVYQTPSSSSSHQSQPYHTQSQQQIYSNQSIYQNLSMMSTPNSNSNNSISNNSHHDFQTYDIPKPATPINYENIIRTPNITATTITNNQQQHHLRFDTIRPSTTPIEEESYDIPRPLQTILQQQQQQQQNALTPSTSNSSLLTSDSLSLSFSSSNRSSLANMPDYDIPRRNPLPVRAAHQAAAAAAASGAATIPAASAAVNIPNKQLKAPLTHAVNGSCMTYDFPLPNASQSTSVQQDAQLNATTKELPLELNFALETLVKLQNEATAAITRLLSFVAPNWRLREKLEPVIMEVKLAAVRLRTALHDLTEFSEGALGNATRSEDRTLALKLRPLVRALRDADRLIHDSAENLEKQGSWNVESLARTEDKATCKPDSLDQLIACAQTLTEDVRQSASFIQGNASLLFKRQLAIIESNSHESINATTPTAEAKPAQRESTNSAEWLEDYDYVSFESKDAAAKKNIALREAIPATMKNKFDNVIRAAETTAVATSQPLLLATAATSNGSKQQELSNSDKQVVRFYAKQISLYMGDLGQAIDSFLETVEKNHPPKYFIAYGKFVVVSAHNLVAIGDNVHRNVSKTDLREKILRCTDALSEALKTCVNKSKNAAAHFPSVTAVQEMVDSVVDISHLASDLKTAMLQAVQLTI